MACNGRSLSYERADERAELAYCQGCKACPRYVQDVSKMLSNHRNKRLVTLLGSYTKRPMC